MTDIPILTKEEIYKRRNKEISLTKSEYSLIKDKYLLHHKKYDFYNYHYKPGQHFLYELIKDKSHSGAEISIGYPKLGIYINSYPCDQTLEIEWIDHRRTWEYNFRFNEYCFVGEEKLELNYLPLWGDQLLVYGVWDAKPNWKQLKQAYERTWWFYRDSDELRDIQINRILRGD